MGLVSGLSLASYLAWPIFGLTQGPSWWHVHLSAKMDSSEEDSGKLVGHMDWRLLPPFVASQILLVSFHGSTMFLIWISHKTTHVSGYHRAWPRWVVSVNGSLTLQSLFTFQNSLHDSTLAYQTVHGSLPLVCPSCTDLSLPFLS